MKYIIFSISFLFITSSLTYTIPSRKELANTWILEFDREDLTYMYLTNPKLDPKKRRGDVEFFINPYTSTLRIKYVEPLGGFPECRYKNYRTCGVETRDEIKRRDSLIKVHCKDFTKESLCAYDTSKGLLKIKDPAFFGGTLFQIERGNFKEILLKRIK